MFSIHFINISCACSMQKHSGWNNELHLENLRLVKTVKQ